MKQKIDIKAIEEFNKTEINALDFTRKSEDAFYDAVDLADFQDKDAETIFQYLKKEIRLIPFGDYLKRYIYLKSGMLGDYTDIDVREYQHIIVDSFSENNTPKSFAETTAKLSALAKNWLTQASVNRSVVFLLGFGLNMSAEDVSGFLTKALRERDFDFKDAAETICWYCFQNGYKYPKMLSLKQRYDNINPVSGFVAYDEKTIGVRNTIKGIKDDETLLEYLAKAKSRSQSKMHSLTAGQWFSELYMKCKDIIADFYTMDEQERQSDRIWTPDDIAEGDVEKVLCCGTPVNRNGNLERLSASKLAKYFNNKRFSRQHIAEILSQSVAVDRFDLDSVDNR